jgi:hypothetical protein
MAKCLFHTYRVGRSLSTELCGLEARLSVIQNRLSQQFRATREQHYNANLLIGTAGQEEIAVGRVADDVHKAGVVLRLIGKDCEAKINEEPCSSGQA